MTQTYSEWLDASQMPRLHAVPDPPVPERPPTVRPRLVWLYPDEITTLVNTLNGAPEHLIVSPLMRKLNNALPIEA